MDRQESETIELTADELDMASGGIKNNQTEAWAVVQLSMLVGRVEAGARCTLG